MSLSSSLGSTAPINFTGLASGLDTNSIIQKLMSLDQAPVTQLQNQQAVLQNQQQVYSQLSSLLSAFQTSASTLNSPSAFQNVSASSSDTTVATVVAGNTAQVGTYNLTVTQLALAQKLSSAAQTNATTALGYSGTAVINGKSFSISNTDTLTTIAQTINGLNAGVTASIVNGGTGNTYLTLTSTATGSANQMQIGDMSGTPLESLGLTNGATSIRSAITNGAQSFGLSSGTTSLQSVLGATTSGSITINGTAVSVNFATDSLQTIANNINANVSGVSASVKSNTSNGATTYQLQITGNSGTPTFVDSGDVLQSLGILQQGASTVLVPAQDAAYKLDNVSLTSSSNTITTAIPGTTLTLLKGTPASPATSTLTFSQNTAGIISNLQNFVTAYNGVVDYISQNSQFDSKSFQAGPLFGDSVANQIQTQMSSILFSNVPGYSGSYPNLASLGFTLSQTGDLSLNTSTVTNALSSDPQDVMKLFEAVGQGSNSNLSYVTSTSSTKASTAGPYAVSISQLATKASYVAGTAQTQAESNAETLTFNGSLFNTSPYSIILNIGATLAQNVAQINSDPKLSQLVTAKITNGALEIDSNKYGSGGNFSVTSNLAAGANNSGVGTGGQGTTTNGLDTQGTINGEAATGNGQFLTGNTGNANTSGLQIQYVGTSTGLVGTMSFSNGVASQLYNLAQGYTTATTGLLATASQGLQNQIDGFQTDITSLQAQLQLEKQNLTQEFAAMENAMSQLQAQSQSLGFMLSANAASSASSSTKTTSTTGG